MLASVSEFSHSSSYLGQGLQLQPLAQCFFFFQISFIYFLKGLRNGEGLVGLNSPSFLKQKFGSIKQVDKGWITTMKDLESWRFKR